MPRCSIPRPLPLSTPPWQVGLDDGISPEGRAAAQRAFESARGGEGGGAAIWIATNSVNPKFAATFSVSHSRMSGDWA